MMIGWSQHTGASVETAPENVIGYLMSPEVSKTVGTTRQNILRDPAPELLMGNPSITRTTLRALRHTHIYSVATLSFAKNDISVAAFNAGDPDLRQQIGQTLGLFFEAAYAGIPPVARLQPLVGTHTHTGRLEVNILMPRAVWKSVGQLRAHNPHPPGGESMALWDHVRDLVNLRFEWADPMDRAHMRMTAQPNWLLKKRSEGARHGEVISQSPRHEIAALAEALVDWEGLSDREELIPRMQTELEGSGIIITRYDSDSVTFHDIGAGQTWRMRGLLFSDAFAAENPLMDLPGPEFDELRLRQLRAAPSKLATAMMRRATFNASRYQHAKPEGFDPAAIIRQPGLRLPMRHPCADDNHKAQFPEPTRAKASRADQAMTEVTDLGLAAEMACEAMHTRRLRYAGGGESIFSKLQAHLARLILKLRQRQSTRILARSLRALGTIRWVKIADKLETLNDRHALIDRMAGTAGRTAQTNSVDRAVAGDLGTRSRAGSFGRDRADPQGVLPDWRADGASGRRDGRGSRASQPNARNYDQDGATGAGVDHSEQRHQTDPHPTGGADAGIPSRGDLICFARLAAARQGITSPRLKFVVHDNKEWLSVQTAGKAILFDGMRTLELGEQPSVAEDVTETNRP